MLESTIAEIKQGMSYIAACAFSHSSWFTYKFFRKRNIQMSTPTPTPVLPVAFFGLSAADLLNLETEFKPALANVIALVESFFGGADGPTKRQMAINLIVALITAVDTALKVPAALGAVLTNETVIGILVDGLVAEANKTGWFGKSVMPTPPTPPAPPVPAPGAQDTPPILKVEKVETLTVSETPQA